MGWALAGWYSLYDMKICMLLVRTREHGEKRSVLQRQVSGGYAVASAT